MIRLDNTLRLELNSTLEIILLICDGCKGGNENLWAVIVYYVFIYAGERGITFNKMYIRLDAHEQIIIIPLDEIVDLHTSKSNIFTVDLPIYLALTYPVYPSLCQIIWSQVTILISYIPPDVCIIATL